MRRRSLFLFLGLSALLIFACNPPDRIFDPQGGTGGNDSGAESGGQTSSGDGDGEGSGGLDGGDGDGDAPGGGTGDGDGDGDGSGGNISVEPCGDGQQSSEEECDDGNTDEDDGCSSSCEVEEGWFCPAADTSCLDCRGDYPLAGCPCTKVDEQVCAGPHQEARLKCDGTVWGGLADCDGGTLCEQETGECLAVIAQCENTSDGYQFCGANNVRHTCGPDWVTTEDVTCAGACQEGSCNAPDCGDGVLQTDTESCDDGNLNNSDGCDDQCTRTPGWYCPEVNEACLNCSGGPKIDCPCVDSDYPSGGHLAGEDACNGAAQKVSLECSTSTQLWTAGPVCSAAQNCEQATGTCKNIVSGCSGKTAGYTFCATGDVRHVCDADLVNTSTTTCQGVCSSGACQAPRCGDGKIQSGETCDDGNNTAADGCEPASSSAACQKSRVIQLAAGADFSCSLLLGGQVRCWGDNEYGQLGVGNLNAYKTDEPWEIPLVQLSTTAVSIAASSQTACAVLSNGNVQCWGANADGQLGQGSKTPDRSATALTVDFSSNVAEVAVGGGHVCTRLSTGTVQCWGRNTSGQLGNLASSTVSATTAATQLAGVNLGGTSAIGLALVGNSSCAVMQGGAVYCWGSNSNGVLGLNLATSARIGDDETPASAGPLAFRGAKAIAQIEGGASHFCARSTDGYLQCWGRNADAQLGTLNHSTVGDNALSLATGAYAQVAATVLNVAVGSASTCAILTGNELKCWGSNEDGQLGMALSETEWGGESAKSPHLATNLLSGTIAAADLGHGTSHVCALSGDNSVRCWGLNEDGQLGRGNIAPVTGVPSSLAPVDIFSNSP